jgi:hypothetical protein
MRLPLVKPIKLPLVSDLTSSLGGGGSPVPANVLTSDDGTPLTSDAGDYLTSET